MGVAEDIYMYINGGLDETFAKAAKRVRPQWTR